MEIRIVITGGSGFIGTNVVQYYIDKGVEVLNIDIVPPRNREQLSFWQEANILDSEKIERIISDFSPTHLIHLAARADLRETKNIKGYDANTVGVSNIIKSINNCGTVKRTIFASSMLVCERGHVPADCNEYKPNTLYGESKVIGEKIVKEYENILSEWAIIRPSSIWGPWFDEPYRCFFDMVIKKRYVHIGNISCTKTFGFVKNTTHQIDQLLFSESPDINHRTFYLGDYEYLNISEWADQISSILNNKPFRHMPFALFKVAAVTGDILKAIGVKRVPMTSFRLKNMMEDNIVDLSDVQRMAPSLPYSREEGIRETLQWMRDKEK